MNYSAMVGIYTNIRNQIFDDWRDLGFYFNCDDEDKNWVFEGSKSGLIKFSRLLKEYAKDEHNYRKSEHDHYGPYMSLKIMTWDKPIIDGHLIGGSIEDIDKLSDCILNHISTNQIGDSFEISSEFFVDSDYKMAFLIKENNFDPASIEKKEIEASWNLQGFRYDFSQDNNSWVFEGSKKGFQNFCSIIQSISSDKKSIFIQPYCNFKISIGDENTGVQISKDGLSGPSQELKKLSNKIQKKLEETTLFEIENYDKSDYKLIFILNENKLKWE